MENISGYLVEERLGRGGMGAVYKARAPITDRVVALKILMPRDDIFVDLVGEEKLREIFIEEARIMGGICHEHVAQIIACNESGEVPSIVLEYFPHSIGSLIGDSTRIKTSRVISVNMACQYLRQALRGLERLHVAGIIHRDIKPHNLMIAGDDRIKIIDFGLCKVRGKENMGIPGMQVGSPYYTAPEQELDPNEADERSDLFSVGAIAYRLLTGRLANHRDTSIPAPSTFNKVLNDDWDEFLLKSIQTNARDRYQSAHEMRLHLDKCCTRWMKQSNKNQIIATNDRTRPQLESKVLRTRPRSLSSKELQELLDLDRLMCPRQSFLCHYEVVGTRILKCLDTGLLWQREGAGFSLNWQNASGYIDYLNEREWQGHRHWRLPTVEELGSLLYPPERMRKLCVDSYIAGDIHWLWSCDTSTRKKAWVMDMPEGYFLEVDKDAMASICAVATST